MDRPQTLAEFLGTVEPARDEVPDVTSESCSVREFARCVLASPEYRASLLQRIILGRLPPQIEVLLYYYAEGKPVERIEHTGRDGEPIETISEVRRVIVRVDTADFVDEQERRVQKSVTH